METPKSRLSALSAEETAYSLLEQTLRMEDAREVRYLLTNALEQAGLGRLVRAGL